MTGVPSRASRLRTRSRPPSLERTSTRWRPMGLGRSGERVLKTPTSGLARSSRGWVRRTSRRSPVEPRENDDPVARPDVLQPFQHAGDELEPCVGRSFVALLRRGRPVGQGRPDRSDRRHLVTRWAHGCVTHALRRLPEQPIPWLLGRRLFGRVRRAGLAIRRALGGGRPVSISGRLRLAAGLLGPGSAAADRSAWRVARPIPRARWRICGRSRVAGYPAGPRSPGARVTASSATTQGPPACGWERTPGRRGRWPSAPGRSPP